MRGAMAQKGSTSAQAKRPAASAVLASARNTARSSARPSLVIAAAVSLLALPSAVLAFSARFDILPASVTGADRLATGSGTLDPKLARAVAARPEAGGLFRFTPAGTATRPDRSVTVVVRVDVQSAHAITVRGILPRSASNVPGLAAIHIAPTAYSLRGASGPARSGGALALSSDIRKIEMPDLSVYKPSPGAQDDPSRFAPRLSLDDREKPGRAPRTFEGSGDQTVDLGGAYRITRNLDVTAGVRYSQERDRLAPVRPDGKQDSQAVYVGTQFRF